MAFFLVAVAVVAVAWWLSGGAAGGGEALGGEAPSVDPRQDEPEAATEAARRPPVAVPASTRESAPESAPGRVDASPQPRPDAASATPATRPAPLGPIPAADGSPRIALVIDDLGRSIEDVRRLAALGVPVTYAVLPFETLTPEVVAEVETVGGELLLHLPMEGRDGANPGPGALRVGMPRRELRAATRAALDAVPGAVGVNNHMGSVLSADATSMRAVLGEIAKRDVYFLDSRTTADSVAYPAARDLGLPAAERDVFLDGDLSPAAIRHQFRRALEVARSEGSAIAIGHPHAATLQILESEVPQARAAGYTFVPVSTLLDRSVLPE